MSKKVIAMSLWGNVPMYTIGALKNADLKNKYFPDWELWVYHNNTVPQEILEKLTTAGCKLINSPTIHSNSSSCNMFWRFYPASDPNVERFIVRDADSRLSLRDVAAIDEWVDSGKDFHIIREHPAHSTAICGGMWGCLGGSVPNIKDLIDNYLTQIDPGTIAIDQLFLANIIYPEYASKSSFVHDEFTSVKEAHAVPIKRDLALDDFAFIGEAIDENDNDRWTESPGEQREAIKKLYYAK